MILGMTTNQPSDRDRVAAVIRSLADAIHLVQTPVPTSVMVWAHHMSRIEILEYADRHSVPVKIHEQNPLYIASATIEIPFGDEILPRGTEVTLHASCFDLSPDARDAYAAYNARLTEENR